MIRHCLTAAAALLTALPLWAGDATRIVSVGGAVTEIVYALDEQDRLIARDTTSTFPAPAMDLPDVGYARRLSPEGVLSVGPDMILATEGSGPPETLQVLEAAQVELVIVPEVYTADGVITRIQTVGAALNREEAAQALADQVKADLDAALAARPEGDAPKVLFILSAANDRIMAAGRNTAAAGIIDLAGGQNVFDSFEGYKPVTDEAILQAAPDTILMMKRVGDHGVDDDDLFALPAIAPTPAAQNRKVVRMNGLHLLGFGPRTAAAITELSQALHDGEAQ